MNDVVRGGIIAFGVPFVIVALVSGTLRFFVALRSPPTRRAAWTVGPAFLVATALYVAFVPQIWWLGAIATVPPSALVFWWWRNEFRQGWINDAEDAPEGVELANDDWRVGLMLVVGVVVAIILGRLAAHL